MSDEFLARSLNSNQLLALLFICENRRKHLPVSEGGFNELLETFADRLGNVSEDGRFEIIEAHLMSVEDIDVYDNAALKAVLDENCTDLEFFSTKLNEDPRFQIHS